MRDFGLEIFSAFSFLQNIWNVLSRLNNGSGVKIEPNYGSFLPSPLNIELSYFIKWLNLRIVCFVTGEPLMFTFVCTIHKEVIRH